MAEALIWGGIAALLLAYLTLFLAREDVSIRPRAVFILLGLGIVSELVLRQLPWASRPTSGAFTVAEVLPLPLLAAYLVLLASERRFRLVHAGSASVLEVIDEASRRLFLQKDDSDRYSPRLTARGLPLTVRVVPLGSRFVLLMLPRARQTGKLKLFLDYLAKRYPGPVPRFRIDLSRR